MRRSLPIALVSVLALCLMALPAFAHEPGSTYEVVAVKATEAPTLDGVLDDAAWLQAALNNSVATGFVNHPGTTLMKGQTVVFAAWTEEALYLAYANYRDMSKVTMYDDGVVSFGVEEENEFWFDYNHSHMASHQFAWDAYGSKYATDGNTAGMEVATSHNELGWFAEVKLPWNLLKIDAPAEGTMLGWIFTGYNSVEGMYFGWSPTYGSFNNPPLWGGLILGGQL